MVKPDFFLVGAPKCGTTALFQYLCMHPSVYSPRIKEPNYFCEDFPALRGPRTELDYLALYADAIATDQCVGDASVVYMYSSVALQKIYDFNPAAKIIFMLRNPVDMVYSLHSQYLYTLNEDESDFAKAWELQSERLAGRHLPRKCLEPAVLQYETMGRMSVGLHLARTIFPEDQMKILMLDDIKDLPQQTFDSVVSFLGLPPFILREFPVVNANKTNKSKLVAGLTQRGLPGFIRRPARALKRVLGFGEVSVSAKLDALNKTQQKRPPLAADMRQHLGRVFAAEITELEGLTGRNLDHWRRANEPSE
jgi:hypothetical protein